MITYRAIHTDDGQWTVGWYVNRIWQGLVWGSWHATERDAQSAIRGFSEIECRTEPLARKLSIGKPRQQRRARRLPEA